MANVKKHKGTIGILTGGGDVPGLNPAIRAVTVRALREGYRVLGIRRGWAGLIELDRDDKKKASSAGKPDLQVASSGSNQEPVALSGGADKGK